jgi:hypothetical protein
LKVHFSGAWKRRAPSSIDTNVISLEKSVVGAAAERGEEAAVAGDDVAGAG